MLTKRIPPLAYLLYLKIPPLPTWKMTPKNYDITSPIEIEDQTTNFHTKNYKKKYCYLQNSSF